MTVCKHCFVDTATLRSQSERIEILEAENTFLRKRAEPESLVPPGYRGLTMSEAAILSVLLLHERASMEALLAACPNKRTDHTEMPDPKMIDVYICRIRKKIAPLGLEIQNIWGYGYAIPREHRDSAKQAISA